MDGCLDVYSGLWIVGYVFLRGDGLKDDDGGDWVWSLRGRNQGLKGEGGGCWGGSIGCKG